MGKTNDKIKIGLLFLAILVGITSCSSQHEISDTDEIDYCISKVNHTLQELRNTNGDIDYTMMPRNIEGSQKIWQCRKASPEEWCSGFWPGILWYAYENSGDSTILKEAEKYTDALEDIVYRPVYDHDLGFLIYCSYGNGYRLTHNEHYRQVLINAADSLSELFNPMAGTLLAWPRNIEMFGGHNTIMDTMMNLELLFWASKNGGNPYLFDVAVTHAETTMKHHFRPDYSCYHVAVYDSVNGNFIRGCNHQGYSDESMWARGQAWAIYGYTTVFKETQDYRFLEFVQRLVDCYLNQLPGDKIPYWDFRDPSIPNVPRDVSAACIVTSALVELSKYVDKATSKKYMDIVDETLASLASSTYHADNINSSFLLHSTGNKPAGSEIDASIVYADYYYLEALTRYKAVLHPDDNHLAVYP